jgi:hypothetical protein
VSDPTAASVLEALAHRTDLSIYPGNELLLFALELDLGIEDIHTVAASSLTDGPDDKKCDLVYVDRDTGRVVLAQGYQSTDLTKPEAPANKASDLNTAVGWLLASDVSALPKRLRAAGEELDGALRDGVVTSIDIWYVHNLPESDNVAHELATVQDTANALVRQNYPETDIDSLTASEIGRDRLEEWYRRTQVPILVTDEFRIPIAGGFEEIGDRWSSFCTSVPATWLRELFIAHKTTLFSANVRDYLGSRKSDKNIKQQH